MNKTKLIVTIAMMLTFCMMLSVSVLASNDLGVNYTATLNTPEIHVSDVDQTVTLTIAANKTVDVDGIAFTVVTPSGFGTAVSHPEIPFTKADYYETTKIFGWSPEKTVNGQVMVDLASILSLIDEEPRNGSLRPH